MAIGLPRRRTSHAATTRRSPVASDPRRIAAALGVGGALDAFANPSYARTGQHGVRGTRFHLDHRFARRCLSAYLDGELEPSQRQRLERHLVECESCGRTRQALVRVLAGLRGLGVDHRRDVARGAIERLRAEEVPQRNGGNRLT